MKKTVFRASPWIIIAMMTIFMLFFTIAVKADDETGNIYPSMQGGTDVYPSMQGGSDVYPSMQSMADVYPSMQNGNDISGAVYAVKPVTKTIDDAIAVEVSGVPSSDLHFIQEWDITSDTYPLNVSFSIAGAQNQTLYIFSDSNNGWSQVQKGPGSFMTLTFTENTHAAVYVGPSLLTDFHIDDMEIIAGTCGTGSFDTDGESFYMYIPSNSRAFKATYVYDGVEYATNTTVNLPGIPNSYINMNDYFTQHQNPWEPGHTYPVTATLSGKTCTFYVTIVENKLTEFQIENISILEKTYGYMTSNPDGTNYYSYSLNRTPNSARCVYDGIEYKGTYREICQRLSELTNAQISEGDWSNYQSAYDPWVGGETYEVTTYLMDKACTYKVTIEKAAMPELVHAVEGTDLQLFAGYYYSYSLDSFAIAYEPEKADTETEWTSADESIVTVSVGKDFEHPRLVTYSAGQTVITARSKANPDLVVAFNVTVSDEEAPVGTYTTTVKFGPRSSAGSLIMDEEQSVTNPDKYFLKSNSDCILQLMASGEICVPRVTSTITGQPPSWAEDLTICEVTQIAGGGNPGEGEITTGYSYLLTAKKCGTETIRLGNDYEMTLIVGDYTITFKDEDGEVLQTTYVAEGEVPEYTGGIPTKEEDAHYTYTFAGWTPELKAATEDATYVATYKATPKKYAITWKNEDGTVLATEDVAYGTVPEYKGEAPTKEADVQYTYTFDKWTPEIASVTGEATYTATFKNAVRKYEVTWKNEDGTVLATEDVAYGTVPEYKGETPTKEATVQYAYTFNGWTPEVTTVSGNSAYTATYEKEDRAQTFIIVPDENDESTNIYDPESYRVKLDDEFIFEIVYKGNVDPSVIDDVTNRLSLFEITGTRGWPNGDGTFTAFFRTKAINLGTEAFKVKDGYSVALEVLDAQQVEDADYSAVETAVAKAQALDPSLYTKDSYDAVMAAVNAVEYGKTAAEQAEVDAMAQAMEDAIANLKVKTIDDMAAEKGNGWFQADDQWYFAENGKVKKGWAQSGSKWYYMDSATGAMMTGLQTIKGVKYYLDPDNGDMKTGWINDNGTWYYAQSSGALATGWLQSGSSWYYMDPSTCEMRTGWERVGSTWYYMNPSGAMATGWVKSGNDWYYMNSSGAMVTGWVKVGSTWYYMKSSGAMAANEWVTGYYWISASGAWTYQPVGSWKQNSTGWWFGDTSGWYAKNETLKINDEYYTFNAAGYWEE